MLPPKDFYMVNKVPETASKTAKWVGKIFNQLKNETKTGRWADIITPESFTLKYCNFTADVEVCCTYVDPNSHKHYISLTYESSCNPPVIYDDFGYVIHYNLTCKYIFKGKYDNDGKDVVMSFADYISTCLPEHIKGIRKNNFGSKYSSEGFYIPVDFDTTYDMFCTLIDTVLFNIKPVEWFYKKSDLGSCRYEYFLIPDPSGHDDGQKEMAEEEIAVPF